MTSKMKSRVKSNQNVSTCQLEMSTWTMFKNKTNKKCQLVIFRYNDMALRNWEILWISGFALFTNAT